MPTETKTSHTPLPWVAHRFHDNWMIHHESEYIDGGYFCTVEPLHSKTPEGHATCEANAAFIVRAVNAHDALVEALTFMAKFAKTFEDDDRFRIMLSRSGAAAALKLATE